MKWLLFAISSCLLISCASPPDVAVFESLAPRLGVDPITKHTILIPDPACMKQIQEIECGHGVYIMSGKEIFIGELPTHLFNKKPWSQVKLESIYVPAVESYAPLSTWIINQCTKNNCNSAVDSVKVKLDSLNGIQGVLQNNLN